MMHECKRLLNDSTVSDGVLFPGRRATGGDDGVAHLLVVPRAAAVDADAGLAAEHGAHGAVAEHAAHGEGCPGTQHISSESTSSGDDDAGEEKEPPCKRLRLAGDEVTDEESADDHESKDNACDFAGWRLHQQQKANILEHSYSQRRLVAPGTDSQRHGLLPLRTLHRES